VLLVELAQERALTGLSWTIHDDDAEALGEHLQLLAR
jgi:hypothetical protein